MYMVLNAVCLVAGIAVIKHLTLELSEPVIVLFRHLLALMFFGPSIWRAGFAFLRTPALAARAAELGGYGVAMAGEVRYAR